VSMELPEFQEISEASRELWQVVLEYFNALSMLRTYPIGVPSLMAGRSSLNTPIGSAMLWEIPSIGFFVFLAFVIILLGIGFGVYYFSEIARFGATPRPPFSLQQILQQYLKILMFSLIFFVGIGIVCIPLIFIVSLLSLVNPMLMQMGMIFIGLTILWLVMPLIFSIHGIFAYQNNFMTAMLNSARMVRYFLPATGFFLVSVILISEGLDVIWLFPAEDSWMTLVGISGHAFIATSLVASSFSFYRQGISILSHYMPESKPIQPKTL